MRELPVSELTAAVRRLCIEANYQLPPDVTARLQSCRDAEPWPPARDILDELLQNAAVAAAKMATARQRRGLVRELENIAANISESYPDKSRRKMLVI